MILTPKRKMVDPKEQGTAATYITQTVINQMTAGSFDFSRLWVKERLRIPVGTDKYGA